MSQSANPLPLGEYPGYFPASKPPFWRPSRIGIGTGLLGLFLGIGIGAAAGGQDAEAPAAKVPSTQAGMYSASELQTEVNDAVDSATTDLQSDLERQRAATEARLVTVRQKAEAARTRAVRRAVTQAVTKARAQERAKAAAAVAAARSEAEQAAIAPLAAPQSTTDPRFSYCYEVVAAGYGPYYEGQDPEYNWYTDADNDGSVCE